MKHFRVDSGLLGSDNPYFMVNSLSGDDTAMPVLMLYAIGSKDHYDKVSLAITQALYMLLNLPQNTMP